jgi:hypothetical protein
MYLCLAGRKIGGRVVLALNNSPAGLDERGWEGSKPPPLFYFSRQGSTSLSQQKPYEKMFSVCY